MVSHVIELASGFAVLQSTTLAVLGMVSLLYLYRRFCSPSYTSLLQPGEVRIGVIARQGMWGCGHFTLTLDPTT